jgi:hypothetical protein
MAYHERKVENLTLRHALGADVCFTPESGYRTGHSLCLLVQQADIVRFKMRWLSYSTTTSAVARIDPPMCFTMISRRARVVKHQGSNCLPYRMVQIGT